jgi:HEAT repeat protein
VSDPASQLAVSEPGRRRIEAVDRLVAAGTVGELAGMLGDPSWAVRRAVVAGLASLGDAAVPAVLALLSRDRSNEARIAAAIDTLVASTGEVVLAVSLLEHDPSVAVVADAAQILGRRGSPRAIPVLVRLMEHADDNVAVTAIEALGRVGGRAAVEALVRAVESDRFFRVFPAIDVLGRSGDPRAVAPLTTLLGSPLYALEAARALGRSGDRAAVAPLAALLGSSTDANVRVAAVALGELFERHREKNGHTRATEEALEAADPGERAVRRLGQCVQGAEPQEQTAICFVLGLIGGGAALPALTSLLDSRVAGRAAALALDRIARRASDLPLRQALRSGDSTRREILLPAIGTTGALDEVALCLTDPEPEVRALACHTLARLGNIRVLGSIFERLEDPSPRVVQAAVAAIESLGSNDTEKLALAVARSPLPTARRAALRVLASFGYAAALDVFLEALRDPDALIRQVAIQGLPFIEDPRAIGVLLELTSDPQDRARAAAVRALGQCPRDPRVPALLVKALGDGDAWVRYYACQSLGKLAHEPAAEAIRGLLGDAAGQVRVAAVEALSHFKSRLALDALRSAAKAEESDLQRAAIIGLGMARDPESLPTLLAAASSKEAATRLMALSALAAFADPRVLPALTRAASDVDEGVRSAAIGFLASAPGIEATRRLVGLLRTNPGLREQVQHALSTPTDDRVAGVESLLEGADDELALVLTSALARLDAPEARAALFRARTSPGVPARKAAVTTLSALASPEALAALEVSATEDTDAEVRRICRLLLGR